MSETFEPGRRVLILNDVMNALATVAEDKGFLGPIDRGIEVVMDDGSTATVRRGDINTTCRYSTPVCGNEAVTTVYMDDWGHIPACEDCAAWFAETEAARAARS